MKRAAAKIPKQLRQWENYGQPKIALKVKYLFTAGVSETKGICKVTFLDLGAR